MNILFFISLVFIFVVVSINIVHLIAASIMPPRHNDSKQQQKAKQQGKGQERNNHQSRKNIKQSHRKGIGAPPREQLILPDTDIEPEHRLHVEHELDRLVRVSADNMRALVPTLILEPPKGFIHGTFHFPTNMHDAMEQELDQDEELEDDLRQILMEPRDPRAVNPLIHPAELYFRLQRIELDRLKGVPLVVAGSEEEHKDGVICTRADNMRALVPALILEPPAFEPEERPFPIEPMEDVVRYNEASDMFFPRYTTLRPVHKMQALPLDFNANVFLRGAGRLTMQQVQSVLSPLPPLPPPVVIASGQQSKWVSHIDLKPAVDEARKAKVDAYPEFRSNALQHDNDDRKEADKDELKEDSEILSNSTPRRFGGGPNREHRLLVGPDGTHHRVQCTKCGQSHADTLRMNPQWKPNNRIMKYDAMFEPVAINMDRYNRYVANRGRIDPDVVGLIRDFHVDDASHRLAIHAHLNPHIMEHGSRPQASLVINRDAGLNHRNAMMDAQARRLARHEARNRQAHMEHELDRERELSERQVYMDRQRELSERQVYMDFINHGPRRDPGDYLSPGWKNNLNKWANLHPGIDRRVNHDADNGAQRRNVNPDDDEKYHHVEDELMCRVCYENKRLVALEPCGHFYMCISCNAKAAKCAMCEKPNEDYLAVNTTSGVLHPYNLRRDEVYSEEPNEMRCTVCKENKRAVAILGCGHFYMCHQCFKKAENCEVCDQSVVEGLVILSS